jgi:hypothetical protein
MSALVMSTGDLRPERRPQALVDSQNIRFGRATGIYVTVEGIEIPRCGRLKTRIVVPDLQQGGPDTWRPVRRGLLIFIASGF